MSATPPNGSLPAIRLLFWVAAVYDGILGVAFLLFAPHVFAWAAMTPPNHYGYARFPGALLLIFAVMFVDVATNPLRHRNLIAYGALLKISYCALVFYYWLRAPLPMLWKPFAVIDLVFLVLFLWAYVALRPGAVSQPAGTAPDPMATHR